MIDDRLADELERIGVEGHASMLAEFAVTSRVALASDCRNHRWCARQRVGYRDARSGALCRPAHQGCGEVAKPLVGLMIGPWTAR